MRCDGILKKGGKNTAFLLSYGIYLLVDENHGKTAQKTHGVKGKLKNGGGCRTTFTYKVKT